MSFTLWDTYWTSLRSVSGEFFGLSEEDPASEQPLPRGPAAQVIPVP